MVGRLAYSILVSAPVPFGFRSYWDLVGAWPREVLGLRVWGQGLTIFFIAVLIIYLLTEKESVLVNDEHVVDGPPVGSPRCRG